MLPALHELNDTTEIDGKHIGIGHAYTIIAGASFAFTATLIVVMAAVVQLMYLGTGIDYHTITLASSTKNVVAQVTNIRPNGADVSFVSGGKIKSVRYYGEIRVDKSLENPTATVDILADGHGFEDIIAEDVAVPYIIYTQNDGGNKIN